MHATATYALLLACASIGCSSELGAFDSAELRPPGRVHVPWAPGQSAGGAAGNADAGEGVAVAGSGAAGTASGGAAVPEGCTAGRFVLSSELSNARDVGGTPLSPDGSVACGAVYRGPPLALSAQGCTDAARLGLRTVIDLRTESERLSNPDATCLSAELVFAPLPIPYGLGPTDYLNDLHETASMAAVFHAFGDPAAYPIYFHCTFGRDRTGIVGALLLLTLGASRSAVMQEYLLSQPNVGAYPDSLNAVLDEVEQRGGAEAVLKSLGITDQELAVMRSNAVAFE
jgi:protein-tyrosine phosphatase